MKSFKQKELEESRHRKVKLKQGMQKPEIAECLNRVKECFIEKPKERTKETIKSTKNLKV